MATDEMLHGALNRLAKWRSVFAGWQLGTRTSSDGESKAVKDHREATIILQADRNALLMLLIEKGVFTEAEWKSTLFKEAVQLDIDMQTRFPGMSSTDAGITMKLPEAADTMRRMGFPP